LTATPAQVVDLKTSDGTQLKVGYFAAETQWRSILRSSCFVEWVIQILRQNGAQVCTKYSKLKLHLKREAFTLLKHQANEVIPRHLGLCAHLKRASLGWNAPCLHIP
jgi:hypothetical protein